MSNLKAFALLSVFLFTPILASPLCGQDRAVIDQGKAASVLVDNRALKGVGTGFCVHPSGLFITNSHVVEGVSIGKTLQLVLNSSLENQKTIDARLVRVDATNDLALLEATEPGEYPTLKLNGSVDLYETMTTVAFGFPFGRGLSLVKGDYPTISVNVGKVTSIRRDKEGIQLIQLDAALNPGNSGGPVISDTGEVIGVVSFGLQATGVNFAIPASKALEMLKQPVVTARVPDFKPTNYRQPQKAEVVLKTFEQPLADATVELWIKRGSSPARKFELPHVGKHRFEGMVTAEPDAGETQTVAATVVFPNGKIEADITNVKLTIQGKTVAIADIESIEFGAGEKNSTVQYPDGSTEKGLLSDLPSVTADFGSYELPIDLAKAKRLHLKKVDPSVTFSHIVVVKSGGREIYRSQQESIPSGGASASGAERAASQSPDTDFATSPKHSASRSSSSAADSAAEPVFDMPDLKPRAVEVFLGVKKLPVPGTITDATLVGGGQFLAITLGNNKKLVLVDLNRSAIAKVLPLSSDQSLVTGNMNHLFIADVARGVVERYELETFSRKNAVKQPFSGVILSLTAGYASNGPLLVRKSQGTDALSQATFTLLHPETLKEIKIEQQQTGHYSSYRDAVHVRAAANGKVFGMWCTSHSPQGIQTLVMNDTVFRTKYEHDSAGHVVPTVDGMHVTSGARGILTNELRQLNSGRRTRVPCVPTSHPRFYLSIPSDPGAQINLGSEPFKGVRPGIHEIGSEAALLDIPDLQLGTTTENASWSANDFTLDKRVYYMMSGNLLISIPFTNDHVLLQEFDLKAQLRDADIDYFFIASTAERFFVPGEAYRYQIEVETNRPKVNFELTSGPEGMQVSATGLVTWQVPDDFSERSVDMIVSVSDGETNQSFDTVTLQRRAAKE